MLTLIAITATMSGLLAALLPAIQIAKMRRARTSHGISIPYLAGGLANNFVWTGYAVAFPSLALVLPNALGLLMNVSMLVVAVRYRPRAARPHPLPLMADIAKAVVHDEELAAEFAHLLVDEHAQRLPDSEHDPEDIEIRRRGARMAALGRAA
jgi:hypothetical protein